MYQYQARYNDGVLVVGDIVRIDSINIRIITIVKVDFDESTIHFAGIEE